MPEESSNFVKVFFADKEKVLRQLRDYVSDLKRKEPNVKKAGLFGSFATDTYGPASDVDLLLVLNHSDKRFIDRIPDYMPDNLSVGCDCFPYTESEIQKMQSQNNPWICHILKEVVWL